ncbi:MAG: SLBB domain-containing protein [Candidatus Eisenbacteria bacterium]|nr:SLBB domain-containing protein [Candidatus Eisenbacteria bacterium]
MRHLARCLVLISLVPCLPRTALAADLPQLPAGMALERGVDRSAPAPVPMDGAVDPAAYRLGPGDVLTLSAGGMSEWTHTLTVSPEGTLRVPNLGVVRVAGSSLAQVRAELSSRLKPYFNRAPVDVMLTRPRSFKVVVAGDVVRPGPVTLAGPSRAWDALTLAGGYPGSLRRGLTLRRAGRESALDLMAFQRLGDLSQNPYLEDGDVLVAEPVRSVVYLGGGIALPGAYELRPDDLLGRLVQLAGGYVPAADTTRARILRFRDAFNSETLSVGGASAPLLSRVPLKDGDRVFVDVRAHYHEAATVDVLGAVLRPGGYPIEDGRTRFSEILAQAGGLGRDADSQRVNILRPTENPPPDTAYVSWLLRGQDLKGFEREYTKMRARARAQISLDLRAALAAPGSAADPALRQGDIVSVPQRATSVLVQGEVVRPGLVHYLAGSDLRSYVESAGGFTESADRGRVWVTLGATQQMVPADNVSSLKPGDVVWVPAKDRTSFWSAGKDLITVMAQLATILLVIREATRGTSTSTTP